MANDIVTVLDNFLLTPQPCILVPVNKEQFRRTLQSCLLYTKIAKHNKFHSIDSLKQNTGTQTVRFWQKNGLHLYAAFEAKQHLPSANTFGEKNINWCHESGRLRIERKSGFHDESYLFALNKYLRKLVFLLDFVTRSVTRWLNYLAFYN